MFKTSARTRQQCGCRRWQRVLHRLPPPASALPSAQPSRPAHRALLFQGCPRNAAGPSFSLLFLYSVLGIPSTSSKQITLFFSLHCQPCSGLIGETPGLFFLLIFLKDSPSSSFFPHLGIVPSLLLGVGWGIEA